MTTTATSESPAPPNLQMAAEILERINELMAELIEMVSELPKPRWDVVDHG
jgi:hypothetical protein